MVSVDGHVAIDLRLAGEIKPKLTILRRLNPVPASRRLRGAWRVGRLRIRAARAWPSTSSTASTPISRPCRRSHDLTSRQLIALLHRSRAILRALHAHEILMGMLTDTGRNRMTGASVALRVLVEARQDGLSDKEILVRSPIVLALTAPRWPRSTVLPRGSCHAEHPDGSTRPTLQRQRHPPRGAPTARALGPGAVGSRRVGARRAADRRRRAHRTGADPPHDPRTRRGGRDQARRRRPGARRRATTTTSARRLPASFQLSDLGKPIRAQCAAEVGGGTGAGGGGASGRSRTTPTTRRADRSWSPRRCHPGSGRCSRG